MLVDEALKNGDAATAAVDRAKTEDPEAGGDVGGRRRATSSTAQHSLCRAVAIMILVVASLFFAAVLLGLFGFYFFLQAIVVVAIVLFITSGAPRWLYVALCTFPRDAKAAARYVGLILHTKGLQRRNMSVPDVFQQRAKKHPNKPCFIFEEETWTYAQVEAYSNKVARVFQREGYRKGDVVALMMENRPQFVCLWLGLAKLGVIVPLINYNLRLHPLIHSIKASHAKALIFGSELLGAIKDVAAQLPAGMKLFTWTAEPPAAPPSELGERDLTALLDDALDTPPEGHEKPGYRDPLVYIYTSGTTGLPKAAVINHSRFFFICLSMKFGLRISEDDDLLYAPLPLYHSGGGILGAGQALAGGTTVIIRKKFSASNYFPDCRRYGATVGQYIGEMCRYVLAVPPRAEDKKHKLRLIFGNGLRPQIWTQFVERFNIPQVAEFYGATEGNANIVNIDNTVGAIGFVSRIMPSVYPISIIRVNQQTGEPLRDERGLCMACKPGEPGVFIGKIIPTNPAREFLGYVDKEASQKKVVHDVSVKGDSAFLSGDILVADEFGYLFFKDRTGDTFRWKGENVSTSEVEAVISNLASYRDCVVYGVEIPGLEGRAGMAAIVDPSDSLDVAQLTEGMRKSLPTYARPQFLRLLHKVDLTGTFKLKKLELQEEGFDPRRVRDRLLYLDGAAGRYEPLTEEAHTKIVAGTIRF